MVLRVFSAVPQKFVIKEQFSEEEQRESKMCAFLKNK